MGPAVLITLGVLFLLDQIGRTYWMGFHFSWPALLIVIGIIKLLEHSASMAGHIPRYPVMPVTPGQPITPGYVPPVVTPTPPQQPAGFISPVPPPKPPDEHGGGA
jgi:hypothetical protein